MEVVAGFAKKNIRDSHKIVHVLITENESYDHRFGSSRSGALRPGRLSLFEILTMKVIYGYAMFIGAGWGLALGTNKPYIELFCVFLGLLGWAAVCKMDKS